MDRVVPRAQPGTSIASAWINRPDSVAAARMSTPTTSKPRTAVSHPAPPWQQNRSSSRGRPFMPAPGTHAATSSRDLLARALQNESSTSPLEQRIVFACHHSIRARLRCVPPSVDPRNLALDRPPPDAGAGPTAYSDSAESGLTGFVVDRPRQFSPVSEPSDASTSRNPGRGNAAERPDHPSEHPGCAAPVRQSSDQ